MNLDHNLTIRSGTHHDYIALRPQETRQPDSCAAGGTANPRLGALCVRSEAKEGVHKERASVFMLGALCIGM
jgi:hypothetical protein